MSNIKRFPRYRNGDTQPIIELTRPSGR